jgi:methylthioribose-1-phosphate isomerase
MQTAMRFHGDELELIDQRLLPHRQEWIRCRDAISVAEAIETMVVRGAPAIGCSAAFGIAIEASRAIGAGIRTKQQYATIFDQICARMAKTRPTAVNLFYAIDGMRKVFSELPNSATCEDVSKALTQEAQRQFDDDLATCRAIGNNGADIFRNTSAKLKCITHCNAGALATAGYGTAIGVIRALHEHGKIAHVFADETRPYLQGARLTMYELMEDGIPSTLICDSAAAFLMQREKIDFVVVGADRIAANGDTANKIGTYSLALAAARHQVPFYVAAPLSTFDVNISTGREIPIELRSPTEITHHQRAAVAPLDAAAWNPSFDVTPADLIAGIVTERCVLKPPFAKSIAAQFS